MIYVLNKNKIISYVVASFIVFGLFVFSTSVIPSRDIDLLKVSSNVFEYNTVSNNLIKNKMNNN